MNAQGAGAAAGAEDPQTADAANDAPGTGATGTGSGAAGSGPLGFVTWILAASSALAVLTANASGIAVGDDGVGYGALADSLASGSGYGYFLEHPATIWPPIWPGLMALLVKLTPLSAYAAATLLNSVVAFATVIVGTLVLRHVVSDRRIVMAGTAVIAIGPATIGLGHVLMTDMVFALLVLIWVLVLIRFHRSGQVTDLLAAAVLAWVGFGLRYVGLVLIAFGGLWFLLDSRRRFTARLVNGILYGIVASAAPLAWMLRNRSIDGTFTGERNPSASGLIDNVLDVVATMGRFLLPGVLNEAVEIWALVAIVVLAIAVTLTWKVLRTGEGSPVAQVWNRLGSPLGLLLIIGVGYLAYMLFVRTTTALNELDLRLLFQAYFPLMFLALALCDRLRRLDPVGVAEGRWAKAGLGVPVGWATVNVAAGLLATVMFATGHPYFAGNYNADEFEAVRANPAVEALPADCRVYSNLPNALYPAAGSLWSPQEFAYESSRRIPNLDEIEATLDSTPSCLVWIDEDPVYGHLWSLDELERQLRLEPLEHSGSVQTFRMHPAD